jgi:hypothetical protein
MVMSTQSGETLCTNVPSARMNMLQTSSKPQKDDPTMFALHLDGKRVLDRIQT